MTVLSWTTHGSINQYLLIVFAAVVAPVPLLLLYGLRGRVRMNTGPWTMQTSVSLAITTAPMLAFFIALTGRHAEMQLYLRLGMGLFVAASSMVAVDVASRRRQRVHRTAET
ncbi:hypothetical protein ACQP2F_15680 [Actinoplanes sp. CA-030573]|uniref:hypothetical protein n=1 Tax=Actinoplanes sp. CA-030573 TaxID=3239898 RepID=UPI003D8B3D22